VTSDEGRDLYGRTFPRPIITKAFTSDDDGFSKRVIFIIDGIADKKRKCSKDD